MFVQKSWRDLPWGVLALCSLLLPFKSVNTTISPKYTSADCIEQGTSFLLPEHEVLGPQQKEMLKFSVFATCGCSLPFSGKEKAPGRKVRTGKCKYKVHKDVRESLKLQPDSSGTSSLFIPQGRCSKCSMYSLLTAQRQRRANTLSLSNLSQTWTMKL